MDVGNPIYQSFRPLLERRPAADTGQRPQAHGGDLLLGKGVHPKIVMEMLGHSTITQTMDTYSHVLPDMQDGAVAAMQSALS